MSSDFNDALDEALAAIERLGKLATHADPLSQTASAIRVAYMLLNDHVARDL